MIRKKRSIRTPAFLVGMAFVLGILFWTGSAFGQVRDDVRGALEKTDALIQHAQDLVTEAGSGPGRRVVENAERNQRRAWEQFTRGQLRPAYDLTMRAREELYRALGSLRQDESNDREVERQLEKTDDLLGTIHERLRDRHPGSPPRQLETVSNLQRRAWDLYRERRLRPALRMTLQARDTATKLIENAGRSGPSGGPGNLDVGQRLDRLSDAIENARERLGGVDDPEAHRHWESANKSLAEAREAVDAGDNTRAQRLLNQVRRSLERAMDRVQREVRSEEVDALITAARARWDQMRASVNESDNARAGTLHEQAGKRLAEAEQMLSENRSQRALVQVRRAIELMDRISGQLGQ